MNKTLFLSVIFFLSIAVYAAESDFLGKPRVLKTYTTVFPSLTPAYWDYDSRSLQCEEGDDRLLISFPLPYPYFRYNRPDC